MTLGEAKCVQVGETLYVGPQHRGVGRVPGARLGTVAEVVTEANGDVFYFWVDDGWGLSFTSYSEVRRALRPARKNRKLLAALVTAERERGA